MTFNNLQYGDVFYIDGAPFQCFKKHGRIAACLVLDDNMQHVPAPQDVWGFGLLTTVYSDMRINANNATAQECADYLVQLRAQNRTDDGN